MIGPSEPKSSTPISKRLTRRHFIESAIGAAVGAGVGAPARATTTNEIVMMTATDLSAAIRNKKVSCREVMNAYLDHIDRVNPQFNAIVTRVDRETLLKQSDSADADLAKGTVHGWMHGFPHAVKDLAFTKGIRTTLGSPVFENYTPTVDAIFVERLKSNGAIIIGKTNTPELGLGSQTYNAIFGVTRNAYDPSKTSGGSSGGASVSLALRMQRLPMAATSQDHCAIQLVGTISTDCVPRPGACRSGRRQRSSCNQSGTKGQWHATRLTLRCSSP
jgi:amidase